MPVVNAVHPNFLRDFLNIKNKIDKSHTQHQFLFDETIYCAGLDGLSPEDQYQNLYDILDSWNYIYHFLDTNGIKIDVSVIGSVTEDICEIPYLYLGEVNWWRKGTSFLKAKFLHKKYDKSF